MNRANHPGQGDASVRDAAANSAPSAPSAPFNWTTTFGRNSRRTVDVGCGDGRFLLTSAGAHPDDDHVGIEVLGPLANKGVREAARLGLTNVHFVIGDAVGWLADQAGDASIDALHAYHPQPYYDPSVVDLGILNAAFFACAWRVLRPGGTFTLQTDSRPYGKYLLAAISKHFEPAVRSGPWPDAPAGRTRREQVALRKKLEILRIVATRREIPRDIEPPPPYFTPGRPGLQTVRSALRRGR